MLKLPKQCAGVLPDKLINDIVIFQQLQHAKSNQYIKDGDRVVKAILADKTFLKKHHPELLPKKSLTTTSG